MKQVIGHIDMDSFFCSCEIVRNTHLRGKPVIVGSTGDRGVVSAASYEARKFGVFSATPISKARRLCPDGVYLPVDMNYYKHLSEQIMGILSSFTDDMQQVSVDEAYLVLTETSKEYKTLYELASAIQRKVFQETKMTCSVGISEDKAVSKIASDFRKPNGITIVEDIRSFLEPLPIEKMPGIGKKAKEHYNKYGIKTFKDLIKLDRFLILKHFGMHGIKIKDIALGKYRTTFRRKAKTRSISRENTFREDVNDIDVLNEVIEKLSKRLVISLGTRTFRTVSIKVRYSDFSTFTRDASMKAQGHDLDLIVEEAKELLSGFYDREKSVRLIGVKLSGLSGRGDVQMTLDGF